LFSFKKNRRMKRIIPAFAALCCMVTAQAQNADSVMFKRIADNVFTQGKAYDNLRDLTKKIGHRLAGSPQMVMAENWGVKVMKAMGADKVMLQECKVPHWVRGGKDRANAWYHNPGSRAGTNGGGEINILALGNSIGTGREGVHARMIEISSYEEMEKRKDEIKGKIVFYSYPFNPTFVRTFQSYGDAVRYRGQGASRAARYGAVGVLVRSMSHAVDNDPHTGAMNYNDSFPKIPAAAVGLRDADQLSSWTKMGKEVRISMYTYGKMLPDTIGHNVIGEITGTEFPDQYITIGGHLDSWDIGEGAHDDGAGIVQTLEVLRVLKAIGYKPRYTLRFVLFANEENGLRGGTAYAEEAKKKNEKHFFALESDAGGFTPRGFSISAEKLGKVMAWKSLFLPYGVYEFTPGGGGADIGPLARTFGTIMAGLSPDSQRYFDIHHARGDVLEAVNKRELELGAINMAGLIYLVDKYGL
jgi:carboxypeptidase Q